MSVLESCTIQDQAASAVHLPTLLRRSTHLHPHDRTLLEMIWSGHHSRREIARVLNINPGAISRRVRLLQRRLTDPLVAALLDQPGRLPPLHRQMGIDYFLLGCSVQHLARAHAQSPYEIRQSLEYVRGWFKGRAALPSHETAGRPAA